MLFFGSKKQKPDSIALESGLTDIGIYNTAERLLLFCQIPAIAVGDIGKAQEQA